MKSWIGPFLDAPLILWEANTLMPLVDLTERSSDTHSFRRDPSLRRVVGRTSLSPLDLLYQWAPRNRVREHLKEGSRRIGRRVTTQITFGPQTISLVTQNF